MWDMRENRLANGNDYIDTYLATSEIEEHSYSLICSSCGDWVIAVLKIQEAQVSEITDMAN